MRHGHPIAVDLDHTAIDKDMQHRRIVLLEEMRVPAAFYSKHITGTDPDFCSLSLIVGPHNQTAAFCRPPVKGGDNFQRIAMD